MQKVVARAYSFLGLLALVLLAGPAGLWIASRGDQSPPELQLEELMPLAEIDLMPEAALSAEPAFDPISLPAMFDKEFDGRSLELKRVLDDNADYTRYYIEYISGGLAVSGIMNIPKGTGPWPVLVLIHGYIDPAVYTNGRGLRREQDYFARRGYAVIHPDLRNHAASGIDPDNDLNFRLGYTEDVINAILAVKKMDRKDLDKSRIGLLGHSMGGGEALKLMVVRPDLVQAVALYAPVSAEIRYNFEVWTMENGQISSAILEKHGWPEAGSKFWDDLSPRNFFDRASKPVIIHHGEKDVDVPIAWSEQLYEWLTQAGIEAEYHSYPDEPHEFIAKWPLFMDRNLEFFNRHLQDLSNTNPL